MLLSEELVRQALVQIGIPADEIKAGASLSNDLGVDSTELIEVASVIERESGAELPTGKLKGIRTVEQLIHCVDGLLEQSKKE